jgi:hypothetical protein
MGTDEAPATKPPRLSAADVWRAIGKHSFAVMSHVTASGEPRSSGVVYGTDKGRVLVAVAASSWKARTIADGQVVAVTIPVRRGGILALLFPIPPAAISFHARARVGKPGALDRASLPKNFARLLPPSLAQTCLIELTPEGKFLTYGIGVSLMTMRDPEASLARVPVA